MPRRAQIFAQGAIPRCVGVIYEKNPKKIDFNILAKKEQIQDPQNIWAKKELIWAKEEIFGVL